ncbi:hypothetical protein Agub_g14669 [Astrephomene gubernaculifera]|uniref:Cation/H+ exchanger transmembrane domain-containing protein n=1 Tax=Astrephomene gubernaculifera TaxID=47775 RepID=A0AAD3HSI5_9CHLO|nr:hypothetical protein Agub_g14669 [Astrephomene gubernaculifera]
MAEDVVDPSPEAAAPTSVALLIQLILLAAAFVIGRWLERIRFQWLGEAGAALLLGLGVGLVLRAAGVGARLAAAVAFKGGIFFYVLLPVIMFDAGYSLDTRMFIRNLGSVCAFAFAGTTISCFVVGLMMWAFGEWGWCFRMPLLHNLTFGALISATDPVTVLAVFQKLHAQPDLYMNVFGESVLNDAVGMVLFNVLSSFAGGKSVGAGSVMAGIGQFFGIFLGSTVIGLAVGLLAAFIFRSRYFYSGPVVRAPTSSSDDGSGGGRAAEQLGGGSTTFEVGLAVVFAYGSYLVADAAHCSGIVAVVVNGMVMNMYVRPNLSEEAEHRIETLFKTLASLFELFVFCYIGSTLFLQEEQFDIVGYTALCLLALAVSRAANVLPCAAVVNLLRPMERRLPARSQAMMWWSGLRGAMAFALSVEASDRFGVYGKVMKTCTFYVIFITVLINGGSCGYLLERLRLRACDEEGLMQGAADEEGGGDQLCCGCVKGRGGSEEGEEDDEEEGSGRGRAGERVTTGLLQLPVVNHGSRGSRNWHVGGGGGGGGGEVYGGNDGGCGNTGHKDGFRNGHSAYYKSLEKEEQEEPDGEGEQGGQLGAAASSARPALHPHHLHLQLEGYQVRQLSSSSSIGTGTGTKYDFDITKAIEAASAATAVATPPAAAAAAAAITGSHRRHRSVDLAEAAVAAAEALSMAAMVAGSGKEEVANGGRHELPQQQQPLQVGGPATTLEAAATAAAEEEATGGFKTPPPKGSRVTGAAGSSRSLRGGGLFSGGSGGGAGSAGSNGGGGGSGGGSGPRMSKSKSMSSGFSGEATGGGAGRGGASASSSSGSAAAGAAAGSSGRAGGGGHVRSLSRPSALLEKFRSLNDGRLVERFDEFDRRMSKVLIHPDARREADLVELASPGAFRAALSARHQHPHTPPPPLQLPHPQHPHPHPQQLTTPPAQQQQQQRSSARQGSGSSAGASMSMGVGHWAGSGPQQPTHHAQEQPSPFSSPPAVSAAPSHGPCTPLEQKMGSAVGSGGGGSGRGAGRLQPQMLTFASPPTPPEERGQGGEGQQRQGAGQGTEAAAGMVGVPARGSAPAALSLLGGECDMVESGGRQLANSTSAPAESSEGR